MGRERLAGVRDSIILLTLAFFAPVAAGAVGCVSNEYLIPHDELVRLASLPPETRGGRVHAVQSIGERQGDPVEPPARFAPLPPPRADEDRSGLADETNDVAGNDLDDALDSGSVPRIDLQVEGGADGRSIGARERVGPGATVSPRPLRGADDSRVGPAPARPAAGGGPITRGGPARGDHGIGGPVPRGVTRGGSVNPGASGVSSSLHLSGGGGSGGNGGEVLVVLAVLLVAIAVFAAVGLATSEGARFDGYVEMSPDQPIHLESSSGAKATVPLGTLTRQQVAGTVGAKVMDDEGLGLRLVEHLLDRRGFTFKLDFGTVAFERESSIETVSGLASHIQLGYFFTPRLGLLATAGLGRADDGIGATLSRHQFGLELQALPFAVGPLHLGAYVNGGLAVIGSNAGAGSTASGKGGGGGALLELDVTGRMALTFRAGGELARFDGGWSPAATVAAGLAIY